MMPVFAGAFGNVKNFMKKGIRYETTEGTEVGEINFS
jgi:hypothetical protein